MIDSLSAVKEVLKLSNEVPSEAKYKQTSFALECDRDGCRNAGDEMDSNTCL